MNNIKKIKELYEKAKITKVGDALNCPSCNRAFVKSINQQKFCKNQSGTKCKDYYWNNVTETKRNNTTRISPASAFYSSVMDRPVILGHGASQRAINAADRLEIELNSGTGMDVHVDRCKWCECIICRCEESYLY